MDRATRIVTFNLCCRRGECQPFEIERRLLFKHDCPPTCSGVLSPLLTAERRRPFRVVQLRRSPCPQTTAPAQLALRMSRVASDVAGPSCDDVDAVQSLEVKGELTEGGPRFAAGSERHPLDAWPSLCWPKDPWKWRGQTRVQAPIRVTCSRRSAAPGVRSGRGVSGSGRWRQLYAT